MITSRSKWRPTNRSFMPVNLLIVGPFLPNHYCNPPDLVICTRTGLCTPPSRRVTRQNRTSWRAPPSGVLLSAVRYPEAAAPRSTPRTVDGREEARRDKIAVRDSLHRSHPGGPVGRHRADTSPLSHQAEAEDLQRSWNRDAQQRGAPLRRWRATTIEEGDIDSGIEPESQSRSQI